VCWQIFVLNKRKGTCADKKIIMIRICFTAIAYIISFLSHSNELGTNDKDRVVREQQSQTEYVVQLDSLKEENDLDINDLN
jgi:hypothetical protein